MMNIKEVFFLALKNIRINSLRSFLTMVGIIVGVASIIVIISVGGGAQKAIDAQYERLGINNISIISSTRMPMTLDVFEYVMARCPTLIHYYTTASTPEVLINGQPAYNICAATPEQIIAQEWPVSVGSFIAQDHVHRNKKVIVLGSGLAKDLYGNRVPIGEYIKIRGQLFEIIGIMSDFGVTVRTNQDMRAYIPASTYARIFSAISLNVTFVARDASEVQQAVEEIKDAFRHKWGEQADMSGNFRFDVMAEIMDSQGSFNNTIIALLAVVATVSLLVGGIGIMNIMLVTVLERTHEIGIRKALGAKYRDILAQFIIEAAIVSLCGGIVGLMAGVLISWIVAWVLGWGSIVESSTVLLSLSFSVFIGLFSGAQPARKAAKMDPIQALRQ